MRPRPHGKARTNKKRAERYAPYTPPKEVAFLKRAVFSETFPRLTPAWLRSASALTSDFL